MYVLSDFQDVSFYLMEILQKLGKLWKFSAVGIYKGYNYDKRFNVKIIACVSY